MNETQIDDGGRAFPQSSSVLPQDGMSLRDYFAAKAMTAIGRTYLGTTEHGETVDILGKPHFDEEARRCYDWADAMIAERKRR